jgi:hypothetical protein
MVSWIKGRANPARGQIMEGAGKPFIEMGGKNLSLKAIFHKERK